MKPTKGMRKRAEVAWSPPPKYTVSQWAEDKRRLSTEDSAEAGRWDTSVAEYQRGIMDAFTDPTVEDVVLETAAQVGKTASILNCMGYVIDCAPAPMMCVLPTKDDAEEFSKDRFTAALIEPTPGLCDKVADVKSGAGREKSTIQHKRYPGGQLTFAWSNSPSRLASRPICFVFGDEVDKWRPHPTQGDPLERARKRTATFRARRKHVWASTPTLAGDEGEEGVSLIDRMYRRSSRGKFVVPCPHCGTFGVLGFFKDSRGVEPTNGFHIEWPKDAEDKHQPELAFAICHACGVIVEAKQKYQMVRSGHWVHEQPGNHVRGFHLSAAISPWSSWAEMAERFLKAGHNTERLRTFWNEELGEPWEMRGEMISDASLITRKEKYKASVPMGAAVLTAGVDVQKDRLEVKVKGWGPGWERWDVDYRVLLGDPDQDDVWVELDALLDQQYEHESGQHLGIVCALVDAGYKTKRVYQFCKGKWGRFIFPCVGRANGMGRILPSVSRPSKQANGCSLYTIGVDVIKEHVYRCLRIDKQGPGYCHFPDDPRWDKEYFAQLVAEKVVVRTKGFRQVKVWEKTRDRNEALDLECYAEAALEVRRVDVAAVHANLLERARIAQTPPAKPEFLAGSNIPLPVEKPQSRPRRIFTPNNFVNNWR